MKNPDLGDRLTPSPNLRHITARQPIDTVMTRVGKEVSLSKADHTLRNRLRDSLGYLSAVDLAPLDETVSSWDELQEAGVDVFEEHLKNLESDIDIKMQTRILHAGTAGAGAIGAFLKVIPEVVEQPRDVIPVARQSIKTMMAWSSFSASADEGLTLNISDPKPNLKLDDRDIYVGLTFNPDFFHVVTTDTDPHGYATLDYDKITGLGKEAVKKIDRRLKGNDVYFGCPFRRYIPKFYRAMTETAIRSGLLE